VIFCGTERSEPEVARPRLFLKAGKRPKELNRELYSTPPFVIFFAVSLSNRSFRIPFTYSTTEQ
jgi:hypothetical protein